MPLISVLMPVYNVEMYLAEAIESILNQTLGDFELIILDDGSTDGSGNVAKTFTDKRIIYHCNEVNQGLANNLNVGLKMARGKYIARMDGDDISLPERFQTQIDFLEAHPDIDLCSCALQMFGTENTVWVREADPEAVKITMMFYSPVLHATSVWRRESFEKHNLYYDQNAFPAEDYELWSRAVFHCKLVNIPQVLYRYRIHGIQVTKMDERRDEKCRQIRINYISRALPTLGQQKSEIIADMLSADFQITINIYRYFKAVINDMISANGVDNFFDSGLLKCTLIKQYQSKVINFLRENNSINVVLIKEIRIKQIIKLFLYKLRGLSAKK